MLLIEMRELNVCSYFTKPSQLHAFKVCFLNGIVYWYSKLRRRETLLRPLIGNLSQLYLRRCRKTNRRFSDTCGRSTTPEITTV